jgi:hypothetical protein
LRGVGVLFEHGDATLVPKLPGEKTATLTDAETEVRPRSGMTDEKGPIWRHGKCGELLRDIEKIKSLLMLEFLPIPSTRYVKGDILARRESLQHYWDLPGVRRMSGRSLA